MAGFEDQNLLEVKSVRTDPAYRNKRYAKSMLSSVCNEADWDKTLLVLSPEPYDNCPLTAEQLEAWYAKRGFVRIQDDPVLMCRDPVVSER